MTGLEQGWMPASDPRLPEPVRQITTPTVQGLAFAGCVETLWEGVRVGIVGSRSAREDSLAIARRIASELAAAGVTIVSGLARGVDGAAHEAALDAGGRTIAVTASGLACTYPKQHRELALAIAGTPARGAGVAAGPSPQARGVIVTEYGTGEAPPFPNRFPRRNQVIAALSDYLVVVQAHARSGSMSTATAALELGVPIGIGPVDPGAPAFQGALSLIRDGADTVVDGRSVAHRLELHSIVAPGFARGFDLGARIDQDGCVVVPDAATVDGERRRALLAHPLGSLLDIPRTEDDLAELAGLDLRAVRRLLVDLEASSLARVTSDGQWVGSAAVRP